MAQEWQDKVVLVTGGAGGIGKAIAQHFAAAGARVAICDINAAAGEAAAAEIGAHFQRVDVADAGSVRAWIDAVVAEFGRIDVLVNNAGINIPRPALDVTPEEWDRVLDINLKGAFLCSQAAGRQMIAQGHGKIVNMSSAAGLIATEERAHYGPSKAGIIMLTRNLAYEWAGHGINVNAVAPTFVETELAAKTLNRPELREKYLARIPLHRFCKLEDVAGAVMFLASPAADFITGAVLPVDGGIHIV